VREKFLYSIGTNICGGAWKDRYKYVRVTFDHSNPSLILNFSSNMNENPKNESFGLAELDVIYCDSGEECTDINRNDFTNGENSVFLANDDADIQKD